MYDPDIMAAMTGQLDHETAGDRIALKAAVSKQMTDNETGTLLDVRTAVLITLTPPADRGRAVMEVFDGPRWDTVADTFATACAQRGIALEVIDGRKLYAGETR
jgi:hypothetical protein